jgi:hypothetical protein
MKIVIDIPEEAYKEQKLGLFFGCYSTKLHEVIYNGTPLPKGHGRLVDADEIQFENTEFDTYGDYCIAFDAIGEADTIIEADKEGE